jgi:DNA adenine methylase
MIKSILICQYCEYEIDWIDAEIDQYQKGFWCDACDGYTYMGGLQKHKFTLILEDGKNSRSQTPVIKLPVILKKQLSLLRYPGGKSKFIPVIYSKLQDGQTKTLVSPYTGGGSAELAFLYAGVVDELILNDLDVGIYSLYWVMKHMPNDLMERIRASKPTHKEYFKAQSVVKKDYAGCTMCEAAWYTLLVNRLAYSGIYSANPLGGKKGKREELLSRWNPEQLCKRIEVIHKMSDRIQIHNMDACDLIEEEYWRPDTTIFIDPPFVQKGKQLYRCHYDEAEHIRLNVLLDSLHQGMPGADIILTYDNDPLIERIYMYPTTIEKISRIYSV